MHPISPARCTEQCQGRDGDDLTRGPHARPAPRGRASFRRAGSGRPIGRRDDETGGESAPPRLEAAVDGSQFDALSRQVGGTSTRRTTLRSAVGAAAASTLALVGLAALSGETDAAKRKRRRRCKKCRPRALGESCSTNEHCCPNTTNRICALTHGGSSTGTICCGGTGATCSVNDHCCRHFNCVNGFCRP
jgi:hypothetical protein